MFRTDELRQAVKTLYGLIPNRTTMPILQTVAFQTRNGMLELTANDIEKSLTLYIPYTGDYNVCIPAKTLNELLSVISSPEIDIEQKDSYVVINRHPGKTRINTMPIAEYPINDFNPHYVIDIDANTFADALKKCLVSISDDETRPVMTGILLKSNNSVLTIASTDGFRLSYIELLFGLPDFEVIIKGEAVKILLSVLNSGKAKLAVNENKIAFFGDSFRFTAQLVAGNFPDVKRIIPTAWTTEIELDKTVLNKAVKTAMIFARDVASIVKFSVNPNRITVTGESQETGNDTTIIESFRMTGKEEEFAVNGNYVLSALTLAQDRVIIKLCGYGRPIGLFVPGDETFTHLMMPMHLGRN